MKKYLIIIFLGVVSALHAGTYAVMDSTIIEDANGQVVQNNTMSITTIISIQ